MSEAYKPSSCKRQSKTPHRRRATIDAAPSYHHLSRGGGGFAHANNMPRMMMHRRLSLPIKKSVQFSELSEVCVVEHDPTQRWYTGEDHRRFKRERFSDVVSFREQQQQRQSQSIAAAAARDDRAPSVAAPPPPPPPAVVVVAMDPSTGAGCPVGLEQLLSSRAMAEAHSNRKIAIRSILLEQNRQRAYGFRDPDQIAFLSIRLTATAHEGAQKRGKFQEIAKLV